MKNGVGVAQIIVLLGGTSDIGQAILQRIVQPGVARLVLVSRDIEAANSASHALVESHPDLEVHHVRFDAADAGAMPHVVAEVAEAIPVFIGSALAMAAAAKAETQTGGVMLDKQAA